MEGNPLGKRERAESNNPARIFARRSFIEMRSGPPLDNEDDYSLPVWVTSRKHYPDNKSIAEFRRMHRDAISAAVGGELVRFARGCGLIRGEWIAIDGSKSRAVANIDSTRERLAGKSMPPWYFSGSKV